MLQIAVSPAKLQYGHHDVVSGKELCDGAAYATRNGVLFDGNHGIVAACPCKD